MSDDNPPATYSDIDYAIYVYGANDQWMIFQNGSNPQSGGVDSLQAGDRIEIRRVGDEITYWLNGALIYTSLNSASGMTLYMAAFSYTASATYGPYGWNEVPGSVWIEGDDFHYIDANGIERYIYGDDGGHKDAGLPGSIWQESTFVAWLDANSKKRVGHDDQEYADVEYQDVDHTDTPHQDTSHTNTHTNTGHSNVSAYSDHTDTHGDVAHGDYYVDTYDDHDDGFHDDDHQDEHTDTHTDTHGDVPHTNYGHSNVAAYNDHGDVAHVNIPHVDEHTDIPHEDDAHVDKPDYVGST